jgi:hypothetical protein
MRYMSLGLVATAMILSFLSVSILCQDTTGNQERNNSQNRVYFSCSKGVQDFTCPDSAEDKKARLAKEIVLRASFIINHSATVEVFEKSIEVGVYHSTVVIKQQDVSQKNYEIGKMIKGGQGLRLVSAGMVCSDDLTRILILGFEGGVDGSHQGFALVRFSSKDFNLAVLPIVDQGKLLFDRRKPEQVELWTTLPVDDKKASSNAAPKRYVVINYYWRAKGFVEGSSKRIVGPFSPGEITEPCIEIQ